MPKVRYDVTDVEPTTDDDRVPPRGVYRVKVEEATLKDSSNGNPMIEFVVRISKGEFKGVPLWHYVVLPGEGLEEDANEIAERRLAEVVKAFKLKKKGQLDTDKLVDKECQVRTFVDTKYDPDNPRAKVRNMLPLSEDDDEPDDPDEDDEPGDDDDEGAGEDYTWEDIEDMDLDDFKAIIEEEELDIRVTKRSKVETIRDKVAEELGIEPPDEDDEGDGDEDDEDDYDEWSVQELRDECKERELNAKGSKNVLIKRLRKDDEEDGDPF